MSIRSTLPKLPLLIKSSSSILLPNSVIIDVGEPSSAVTPDDLDDALSDFQPPEHNSIDSNDVSAANKQVIFLLFLK